MPWLGSTSHTAKAIWPQQCGHPRAGRDAMGWGHTAQPHCTARCARGARQWAGMFLLLPPVPGDFWWESCLPCHCSAIAAPSVCRRQSCPSTCSHMQRDGISFLTADFVLALMLLCSLDLGAPMAAGKTLVGGGDPGEHGVGLMRCCKVRLCPLHCWEHPGVAARKNCCSVGLSSAAGERPRNVPKIKLPGTFFSLVWQWKC